MTNRQMPIQGHARRAYPGDHMYLMDRPHTSADGTEWPKGTAYSPQFFGASGVWHKVPEVQRVSIDGELFDFLGRELASEWQPPE
jgi:hypothetical protein